MGFTGPRTQVCGDCGRVVVQANTDNNANTDDNDTNNALQQE
jgi:hypothetical protein